MLSSSLQISLPLLNFLRNFYLLPWYFPPCMCCYFLLLLISFGFVWVSMVILQEFLLTAFVAVIFSFLIAKLVSIAMSGGSVADSESKSAIDVDEETRTRDFRFSKRLEVKAFESERKVEEIVRKNDEIEAAPEKVEEISESDNRSGEIEAELRRLPVETESELKFVVVDEESFGVGNGDELGQESASRVEELENEPNQVDETVESDTLSSEMEAAAAAHCQLPENFESEEKFEDLPEEKLEIKEPERMVPETAISEMKFDESVDEKVEREIDEALKTERDHVVQSNEIGVESELESLRNEEKEVKWGSDIDDDDDDWEGIERSEVEKVFAVAAKFVEGKGELDGVGSDVQMEMYGLHKVATEGPCREPQPMALKMNARAKWNAWQRLGNMTPEVAMEQYVSLLSDRVPGWMEADSAGENKEEEEKAGFQAAIAHSSSSFPDNQTNSTQPRNSESVSAVAGNLVSECATSNIQGNE